MKRKQFIFNNWKAVAKIYERTLYVGQESLITTHLLEISYNYGCKF
jgi:hypothetical protein